MQIKDPKFDLYELVTVSSLREKTKTSKIVGRFYNPDRDEWTYRILRSSSPWHEGELIPLEEEPCTT